MRAILVLSLALPCAIRPSFCAETPPLKLPFAVHAGGETVTADVIISTDRVYPFAMTFGFRKGDAADRARVARLVGQQAKDKDGKWIQPPAVEMPMRVEIRSGRAGKEQVLVDQVVKVGRMYAFGADSFSRYFGVIRLTPGRYQIKVRNLADHPELERTPVVLEMYGQTRGNVFLLSAQAPSAQMTEVVGRMRKRGFLDDPSSLGRLPDNSFFPSRKQYPKSEYYTIPMPVAVWNGCSFGIFIDGEENMSEFWISRNCGGNPRQVYLGTMAELFRE